MALFEVKLRGPRDWFFFFFSQKPKSCDIRLGCVDGSSDGSYTFFVSVTDDIFPRPAVFAKWRRHTCDGQGPPGQSFPGVNSCSVSLPLPGEIVFLVTFMANILHDVVTNLGQVILFFFFSFFFLLFSCQDL